MWGLHVCRKCECVSDVWRMFGGSVSVWGMCDWGMSDVLGMCECVRDMWLVCERFVGDVWRNCECVSDERASAMCNWCMDVRAVTCVLSTNINWNFVKQNEMLYTLIFRIFCLFVTHVIRKVCICLYFLAVAAGERHLFDIVSLPCTKLQYIGAQSGRGSTLLRVKLTEEALLSYQYPLQCKK